MNPYLRGQIASFGVKQIGIEYDRLPRKRGSSKFNFLKLLLLALDGVSNHSIAPLKFITLSSALISFSSALLVVFYF